MTDDNDFFGGEFDDDDLGGDADRPQITITSKQLDELVDETVTALVAANIGPDGIPKVFNRGPGAYAEVIRKFGQPELRSMNVDHLVRQMSETITWVKVVGEGRLQRLAAARPPGDVAKQLTALTSEPFPRVSRIVRTPVFTAGGDLVLRDGLHGDVLCLLDPALANLQLSRPVGTDALTEAVELFRYQFQDMDFADEASFSHTVALALLPYARDLVAGPTPLHAVRARIHGSAKTLLVNCALAPFVGGEPESQAEAGSDDWAKILTATLAAGPPLFFIDNLSDHLDSGHLASAITKTIWSGRELGFSRNVTVPVSCAWVVTGNNVSMSGELVRRTLPIDLQPVVPQPWMRDPSDFAEPNLKEWTSRNRRDLVRAAITIIQAWIDAGRPAWDGPVLGSFETWSEVLGGILANAGIDGFLSNLDRFAEEADTDGNVWQPLLETWWKVWATQPVTTGHILDLIDDPKEEFQILVAGDSRKGREISLGKELRTHIVGRAFDIDAGTVRVERERGRTTRYSLSLIGQD